MVTLQCLFQLLTLSCQRIQQCANVRRTLDKMEVPEVMIWSRSETLRGYREVVPDLRGRYAARVEYSQYGAKQLVVPIGHPSARQVSQELGGDQG